jgi:hypothetical protein
VIIIKASRILLVNEKQGSRAEFTAMCLQTANNVTTIGSQTKVDGQLTFIESLLDFTAEFELGYIILMDYRNLKELA